MKKIVALFFIISTILYSQDSYYNVDIDVTGVSQLIIFQASISSLEEGDEIGIFDEGDILNSGDSDSELEII